MAPNKLQIADDLALPIEAVTEAIGFLGRRGSGKSYAAQKLAEELHRVKAQWVALDPVGNWWGLRLDADGKSPGIPVTIFGGQHGDIPIDPHAGAKIADVIVDYGISAIVDVSGFESNADKARFARAFCERFYFRKKSAPSAVHLFLEEAQEFIPQNADKDEKHMLSAFTRLAKLGRNFGIGVSMLSQRPQEVHKKVINLAELLFVFQLTGTHERKAVDAWISDKGIDEDIEADLPKLARGKPHVWSPAWLQISRVLEIGKKWTFDASSTPKVGAGAAVVRELSPIDVEKVRKDMAVSIEKAKAEDPKELKREIATLKAQMKAQGGPQKSEKEGPTLDQAAIDRAVAKAVAGARKEFEKVDGERRRLVLNLAHRVGPIATALSESSADLVSTLQRFDFDARSFESSVATARATPTNGRHPDSVHPAGFVHAPVNKTPVVNKTASPSPRLSPRVSVDGINASEQRVLNALALIETLGSDSTRTSVGFFSGYTEGGRFNNLLGALRTKGLIDYPREGHVGLTDDGRRVADAGQASVQSLGDLHALWLSKLPASEARVLQAALDVHPDSLTRAELGERTGYVEGGRFNNILGRLRSLGAIDYPRQGEVVASHLLFPEGLS